MSSLRSVLNEILQSEIEEFKDLVGSYSFQGHISNDKNLTLEKVGPEDVDPTPYTDTIGAKAGRFYQTPNGFWTSTVYKGYEGFITKWAKSYFRPTKGKYFHAFTITGDPNVMHLGSMDEVFELYDESEYYDYTKFEEKVVRWTEIVEDYDAVHVYGSALDTVYFKNWSVESTVWFDPQKYLKKQFRWKITDELSVDPPS